MDTHTHMDTCKHTHTWTHTYTHTHTWTHTCTHARTHTNTHTHMDTHTHTHTYTCKRGRHSFTCILHTHTHTHMDTYTDARTHTHTHTHTHTPGVEFQPVLQLLGDVVLAPVGQVSDKNTSVEGTGRGLDVQLPEVLVLQVKEVSIHVLKTKTQQSACSSCQTF